MTSTLLRPPAIELEILLWSRQLQKIKFNEYSALRFLSNAMGLMRDASNPDRTLMGRYTTAYEGIFSLCLGSLYLHGMLPLGKEGYRSLVIQLASEMLQLSTMDRDKIMNASTYLQLITCDCPEHVEEPVARDLAILGNRALDQAKRVYPDWFL